MNLGRKIIIGFIACAIVLFGVAIFSFKNTEKFVASNTLVNHSNTVLYEFEQILKYSIDAETGVRGYIITGDAIFLRTFASANSKLIEKIEKVKKLTKDNSTQQKNIEELSKQIKLRLENLNTGVTYRKINFEKARAFVASREGKQIQDEIRKIIEQAQEIERTLLAQRIQESQDDASKFNFVFAVLLLVIGMILIAVYTIIATNLKALKNSEAQTAGKNWLLTGNSELNKKLIGNQNILQLANSTISFLCTYLKANIGAVYLLNEKDNTLILTGKFAFTSAKDTTEIFKLNEGLIGQAAWEQKQISLTDISEDQIRITSSVLNAKPKSLLITPILLDGRTIGVIEIGKLSDFTETEKEFIDVSMRSIAISVNTVQQAEEKELRAAELAIANNKLAHQNDEKEKRAAELAIANEELAYQNQEKEKRAVELSFANKELSNQAEELQIQQEELRQLNEELEQQAQNLKQQQEELQMTNEELEEQTQSLEEKNKEVEASKNDIEKKTKQLEISSKYKSEFLANMSHELRTPLNSLLILSKDLSENRKKNLDAVQVESAEIIYKSGHDLLVLINEVLDLSKIEAGKMNVNIEKVSLKNFSHNLLRDFKHQAEQKGLTILCELASDLPDFIHTDSQRLNQILKNLLSNAIKFTENGSVTIRIEPYTETTLNISVTDTGIGISEDKQSAIFEAFQQAEGGTSRKYGGTGLGLSISRELAKLLEGEIKVGSNLNQGSTFSLIIPLAIYPAQESEQEIPVQPISAPRRSENDVKYLNYPTIQDDRELIKTDDKIVLIIEDDRNFAAILLKQANKKGFKCLSASSGEDGLLLAIKYKPQAIILDMGLPGINGKQVLHELKVNPSVRHIPVHIISANDRSLEPIREGAVEYLMKPIAKEELEQAFNRIENFVDRKIKKLLIIEDSENSRKAIKILIGTGDVECYEAATGKEAIALFENNHIDCIILDIGLPDMTGFELIHTLSEMKGHNLPPIIVYTGKELTKEENNLLHKYSDSIIIKGIKSEERLLDETALFLHRTISSLPKSKQMMIHNLHDKEAIFHSKKILLVDDDMRNIFALSKILQERGMEVIKSEDGKNALKMVEEHSDIDLVLMDIMMPEMDGYEAMKRIRSQIKFRNLPIIALTAKAMKDDKQKCIDAGANDYITKPIDVERLLSLMRVWLSK
ncbi:response regulator [Flavobacterium petrolei]|uniref:histidine kinase n=1 Tax=Flavobacterium petrolei TaxID=2259594 RepID=A0A482TKM9_9FLAO|nr:response regulator [Flavobacterium petrolei]RYJ52033.1 response regulator [Flavobacterium petrolei]